MYKNELLLLKTKIHKSKIENVNINDYLKEIQQSLFSKK